MTGTVTVACKHPHGIHLDVFDNSGQRQRITLKGSSLRSSIDLPGGYALTEVDADHWQAWAAANKSSPLLTERIVFAQTKAASAVSQAQEQAAVKSVSPQVQPDAVSGVEAAQAE